MDNTEKSIVTNDIRIDVYYRNEKDVINDEPPLEVVITFPDDWDREPLYLSDCLVNCFNVVDITGKHPKNKNVEEIFEYKRIASLECYGAVDYHILGGTEIEK